ncbi:hypothetical protein ACUSIJ_17440 [Pseudochelatococcus sp. B33]
MSTHNDNPDREEEDPLLQVLRLGASGRIWLNAARVVDRIVHEFVRDLLGQLENRDTFADWLSQEARRLNDLFLGIVPSEAYATGPWNAPDQCGRYVLRTLGIDGEPETAVRDAFVLLASRIVDLVATSDFDAEALKGEIAPVTRALVGTAEIA